MRWFFSSAQNEGLLASARDLAKAWRFRIIKVNFTKKHYTAGIVFFYALSSLKQAWLSQDIKKPARFALVF